MANDQQALLDYYRNLIESATAFSKGAKFYEDKVTGKIFTPTNTYRELANLLSSKYNNLDQEEFFKTVDANKKSDPLIAQYANPVFSTPEPEEKEEEKKKEKKEEKKEEPVIKGSIKSKSEESEEKKGAEKPQEIEEKPAEESSETTEQPFEQPPTILTEKQQPATETTTYTNTKPKPQIETPVKPLPEETPTPKIDIKPTPFIPIKVEQSEVRTDTQNQKPQNINQPKPINPTPPPVIRTQAQPPKIETKPVSKPSTPPMPVQSNAKPDKIATTAPIPRRVVIAQTIKSAVTSAPFKTAVKEVSFQAQMATKKIINKTMDLIKSFAREVLQTTRNLFSGNNQPEDIYITENVDYPSQVYDNTSFQAGRPSINLPPTYRSRSGAGNTIGNVAKKAWWRNPVGITIICAILFAFVFPMFEDLLNSQGPLMSKVFNEVAEGSNESSIADGTGKITGDFCPTPFQIDANRDPLTCQYLNPAIGLFNTNISQEGINNYIDKYSPVFIQADLGDKTEFTRRVNYIVQQSQKAGLNPALFLGFWKSESAFSTYPGASDMGCAPGSASMKGFEKQVQCALGTISGGSQTSQCTTSKDANSQACLGEQGRITQHPDVFTNPPKLPIATFDDFMEMYGPRSQNLVNHEVTPGGVNRNCSSTYNILLEVAGVLNACQVPQKPIAGPILPIGEKGGRIAGVALQIAGQLLHSVTDRPQVQAQGMICAVGTPGGDNGHYTGYHCWSEMSKPAYDIAQDPDYLQCTEFIMAVFDKAGFGNQVRLLTGNAVDWANNARKHPDVFQVFNTANDLQPGDIISLGAPGNAGHVAVVVKREGNRLQVAQAATSAKIEDWFIDEKTGQLNPGYNYLSRQLTPFGGFIRLKDFKESF